MFRARLAQTLQGIQYRRMHLRRPKIAEMTTAVKNRQMIRPKVRPEPFQIGIGEEEIVSIHDHSHFWVGSKRARISFQVTSLIKHSVKVRTEASVLIVGKRELVVIVLE